MQPLLRWISADKLDISKTNPKFPRAFLCSMGIMNMFSSTTFTQTYKIKNSEPTRQALCNPLFKARLVRVPTVEEIHSPRIGPPIGAKMPVALH